MNTVNDGTQEKMPATTETLSRRQRLLALIFKWADADTMHDCDRRLLMTCSSQSAEACSAFPRCTRLPGLVTAVQIAAMLNTRDLAFSHVARAPTTKRRMENFFEAGRLVHWNLPVIGSLAEGTRER